MRTIFHLDMDAFFASIEIARNPALRGKPVVVGGQPSTRGVVSTCSYEARKFGVRSAMSLSEAYRRCPHAIFLDGNISLYREYSDHIMQVLHVYTSEVEIASVDEAYMDVSELISADTSAQKLAQAIKNQIRLETQLTCSIGIATNKLLAKIASDACKPNGLLQVPAGQEAAFLAPLPIKTIPGIGTKTAEVLNRDGILYVSDLQALGMEKLIQKYGGSGYYFFQAAHGHDERLVESEHLPPKSVGAETTFEKDESNPELLVEALHELVLKAYRRLKRHRMRCQGISLKMRFSNFKTITRAQVLTTHVNNPEQLFEELLYLFRKTYSPNTPLRLLGVSFDRLTDGYWQPSLWEK